MSSNLVRLIIFVACWFGWTTTAAAAAAAGKGRIVRAICDIKNGSGLANISGTILIEDELRADNSSAGLTLSIKLSGFDATDNIIMHGFHVHTKPDLAEKCVAAGPHYNPDGSVHGSPHDNVGAKHVGDFGNINETGGGMIETTLKIGFASLVGDKSIADRALVVHAFADDLGLGGAAASNTTGNSGARLGCCVITLQNPTSLNSVAPYSAPLGSTFVFLLFLATVG